MTGEKLEWVLGNPSDLEPLERYEWLARDHVIAKFGYTRWNYGDLWDAFDALRTESAALKVERDAAISQMKSEERRADEALTELRLVQLRNGEKSSAIDFKTAQLWDSDQRVHQLETESAALRARVAELEKRSDWRATAEWYGQAAHFICGRWCRFHLATIVGAPGRRWLVSTVGDYYRTTGPREAEQVRERLGGGDDSWFESMVFPVGETRCTDAECNCGQPEVSEWAELDIQRYATAGKATAGHIELCAKWHAQLRAAAPEPEPETGG